MMIISFFGAGKREVFNGFASFVTSVCYGISGWRDDSGSFCIDGIVFFFRMG